MTTAPAPGTSDDLLTRAVGRWALDPSASSIRFRQKMLWGLMTVKGSFSEVRGEGTVAEDGSVDGTLVVPLRSLDTGISKRDTHLRSADFFDAERHGDITFRAGEARPGGSGFVIDGELTVAGVTRPIQVPVEVTVTTGEALTLKAELDVNQHDHGMTTNPMGALKGPASITVVAHFTRQS
jgi:polyisoprenoid-binding protein YceI